MAEIAVEAGEEAVEPLLVKVLNSEAPKVGKFTFEKVSTVLNIGLMSASMLVPLGMTLYHQNLLTKHIKEHTEQTEEKLKKKKSH